MKFSSFRRIHFPAGKRVRAIALLGISAFVLASGEAADAAEIRSVRADVSCVGGEIPPSVSRRIRASIEAIGGRVLTGKEDRPFLLDPGVYDKVLADIVNRVVVGYIVSDIQVSYGEDTRIHVTLQPIGRIIQSVDTEIEYGNLAGGDSARQKGFVRSRRENAGASDRAPGRFGRMGGKRVSVSGTGFSGVGAS